MHRGQHYPRQHERVEEDAPAQVVCELVYTLDDGETTRLESSQAGESGAATSSPLLLHGLLEGGPHLAAAAALLAPVVELVV